MQERVALFIDVDNILLSSQRAGLPFDLGAIIGRVREEGVLMFAKAYADWNAWYVRPVLPDFRQNAVELAQLAVDQANVGKNTADVQLAVDALEMALSTIRPETIAIASGDRDFLPLVQKLKRYGIRVIGIGVEEAVSQVLQQACDSFVTYDSLLPPEPQPEAAPAADTTTPARPEQQAGEAAQDLLARAVRAIVDRGREPVGAAVLAMMQQLDPAFNLTRTGLASFKELALGAQQAGLVRIVERDGQDMLLEPGQGPAVQRETPRREREYQFDTPQLAEQSYRTMLQEKRIPLLPWPVRRELVSALWHELDLQRDRGMSFAEMETALVRFAYDRGDSLAPQALKKLLYTLNLGQAFSADGKTPFVFHIPTIS